MTYVGSAGAYQQALIDWSEGLHAFDRALMKMIRNDPQIRELQLPRSMPVLHRQTQFDQVPDRRGNDRIISSKMVLLRHFAESAGQVGCDTGLFSDDESFWHVIKYQGGGREGV